MLPKKISELTEDECDAMLKDSMGKLRLSRQQKRILAAHAFAVAYGFGKVSITITNHKSRITTQLDDLLPDG